MCSLEKNNLFPATSGVVTTLDNTYNIILEVNNHTNISISGDYTLVDSGNIRIGGYNEYPVLNSSGTRLENFGSNNKTINVNGYKYILIAFYISEARVTKRLLENSFQVEWGTPTDYVEHKEQTFIFPLGNEKLMLGDYLADDGIHHVRGQEVYNGSEDWIIRSDTSTNDFLCCRISGYLKDTWKSIFLCSYFEVKKSADSTHNNIRLVNTDGYGAQITISRNIAATVNDFKNWLTEQYNNNSPVIVEYELNEEVIVPYTSAQQRVYNEIKNAYSYDEMTIITGSSDGNKPFFIVQAYKDLNKELNNKVDKVQGKELSSNDFTDTLKEKLEELENYDDTEIKADISGKEDKTNKVTSIDNTSTDTQYPSAKCVYDSQQLQNIQKADIINNTKTGSTVQIVDAANSLNANSVVVAIEPIQDTHGYSKAWAGGQGKNLLDPSKVSTITAYGLTITFSNNVFSISGTPTAQSASLAFNFIDYSDYSLSGKNYVIQALENLGTPIKSIYGFRTEQEKRIAIVFDSVANPTINTTFKLSVSTTSQTVWSPYENICPITGWTGATISQSGEDTSNPTTRNISWQSEAGIIYGGTLDVISGVLTVTDQNIASYNGENLPSTWISDRDVYSVGETPTIGAQVVYKLLTPVEYQLTPHEIRTLLGTNNFWANTGDVTVNYKADTKLYIDSKFQSLEDRLTLLEG